MVIIFTSMNRKMWCNMHHIFLFEAFLPAVFRKPCSKSFSTIVVQIALEQLYSHFPSCRAMFITDFRVLTHFLGEGPA